MAISATSRSKTHLTLTLLLIIFSVLFLLTPSSSMSDDDDDESDIVSELLTLQSQSNSGIIRLSDHLLSRLLSSKPPRPFSLLIFFDALQLHDKSELQLKSLRSEFALLSSSFISNNAPNPSSKSNLFFCDLEFKDSQSSFALFGVNALPHIRLVPNSASDIKRDTLQMDAGDFSRLAESMAEFVESKTKLVVGPIHRPPIVSKTQVIVIVVALLISLPFLVKKLIAGETLLNDSKFWLAGAVFVYFFSVSGAMHNIIRKMPMFLADRDDPSKLVFFYQGSGMQLGAEGFAVGSLYTVVGLLLAFLTHVLVKVRSVNVQRLVMIVALFVSFWAVKKVVFLDNWKTGYGIHMYWPSSWRL
ncbi:putative dolichyl-diphosphooligosaccharide--protein glycosyltransferase subunit 3B [Camellia lanceoleosa]|uniref:Dolichyl-diphosphooligosaccharide--protein glycosyltransferase subunit 3B n=1 Tax=Camellia lanceoleosa TaxID=1840588 RepID=A0ACC0GHS9_9ERIC|nr:putative dolichyl-diphosphooligosaccharide--protein glycosyltransferase subunit 3B [Camellia lanceoleosa]